MTIPNIPSRQSAVTPVLAVSGSADALGHPRDAWVRPGELIVELGAQADVDTLLTRNGGQRYTPGTAATDWRQRANGPVYGDINGRLRGAGLNFELWTGFSEPIMRQLAEDPALPALNYNNVLAGEDFYQGGPGGWPHAVAAPTIPPEAGGGDGQVDIAVLDSGLPENWRGIHPELKNAIVELGTDLDALDENGDHQLDRDAGHGLFICGLIVRMAPALTIEVGRVLHSTGETDDALLCAGLAESTAKVINLSLGGYSWNDLPSRLLSTTVARLVTQGKVVVAAAGNAGGAAAGSHYANRPFWPASLPKVIGVGAYDSSNGGEVLAPFSNAGDVYSAGVNVRSAYVDGWPCPDPAGGSQLHGWATWSGTSFAAPVVAATIAKEVARTGGNPLTVAQNWLSAQRHTTWPTKPMGSVNPTAIYSAVPEPTIW